MAARARRTSTALERVDRALFVVRTAPGVLLPAWLGGAAVAAVVVLVFYFEMVEGVRNLRPALALALVLAWWVRAVAGGRAARAAVRALWPDPSLPVEPAGPGAVLRLASLVGVGLWAWLWVLVLASFLGPVWVVLALPLLALRGAFAPGWLAHAGCEPTGGLEGLRQSMVDGHGQRSIGIRAEMLVLLGAVVLFFNLYALLGMVVALARSLFGLDVALVDTFLSPDNLFVWLSVGSVTLVLMEPLRASLSAVFYLEARFRREGLDLRAMVDTAIEAGRARSASGTAVRSRASRSAALVLLLALGSACVASPAWAAPASDPPAARPPAALTRTDRHVQKAVERILAQPEFQEIGGHRPPSTSLHHLILKLVDKLLKWLDFKDRKPSTHSPSLIPLPPPQVFIVLGAVLLAAVVAYVITSRIRDARAARAPPSSGDESADPRDQPPSAHLDRAAGLAGRGLYREALRALYLATLVALDRRGLITFDPTRTNWQYLRQLPAGPLRDGFSRFTLLFDYKWYGDEPTTQSDYDDGRAIAQHLCAPEESA